MEAKVIGVMHMIDQGEIDDKIIAVAKNDASVNYFNDIADIPSHLQDMMKRFFEDYKKLENKQVQVKEFKDKETAYKIINESIQLYEEKFLKDL